MANTGELPTVELDMREPVVIHRIMLTFDRAADLYLGDCRRRGFTERTITTYSRTYDEFYNRLPVDHDVSKITVDDVRRYLSTKSRLAPGTVAGIEAHLASIFRWLLTERKITRDPMATLPRTKRKRAEDLDVVTVNPADVPKLLNAAQTWSERLAISIVCYLGPRRRAVARLRLRDYDQLHGHLRFQEKGGKVIWKAIPDELRSLIDAAIAAGQIVQADDYLVPPEGYLQRKDERDDRVIWRLVKKVADRAGVPCHVHALRAAFAVYYLEQNPGDVEALKELLGHRSLTTTQVYLRAADRKQKMERVRSLSWGQDSAGFTFESSPAVGAGGFEPPHSVSQAKTTGGGLHRPAEELVDDLLRPAHRKDRV